MKAAELLAGLVKDFHGTVRHPKAARATLFSVSTFPGFTGQLIRVIVCRGGNWKLAVADLLAHRGGVPALPAARVLAFKAWAEKLTARPVRGLLTWKGAAQ